MGALQNVVLQRAHFGIKNASPKPPKSLLAGAGAG
jgi:hypothetical protein